jgi:ELWxxDGT repeat protein
MPEIIGDLGGKTILMECYDDRYRGLWRYDGGGKSAVPVSAGDPAPGAPGELLYFSKWDAATGEEPWVTNGTLEGTHLLKDVRPKTIYDSDPAPSSSPSWLGSAGGKTFFSAEYAFRGRELMVTDGTALGTVLVADLQMSRGSTSFGSTYPWHDLLFFKATNVDRGAGLWRTDGTAGGTIQIKRTGNAKAMDYRHGLDGRFAEAGGKLFFAAGADSSGVELWVSDGTTAGTRLLLDICPGAGDGEPLDLVSVGDRVYFTADDGRHGRELWRSDGTPEGTVMVKDLAPGWEGSAPWGLATTGGKLFWNAWTPASSSGPYVIDSP